MPNSVQLQNFKSYYQRPKLTSQQEKHLRLLIDKAYGHFSKHRRAVLMETAFGLSNRDHQIRPSISYTPLSKYIGDLMNNNHYSRETVVALLREMGVEGEKPTETFLYGGCWHGGDPGSVDQLFETPVDFAIFSDITGSNRVEESKRIYYNEIVNPAVGLLKKGKLNDLINMNDSKEIRLIKFKLKRNYIRLMEWSLLLEDNNYSKIKKKVSGIADDEILDNIRRFTDIKHPGYIKNHGEWMATLPKISREKILKMIEEDTINFINILGKLRKRGTRVIIVEGNWDNRMTLEMIANGGGKPQERIEKFFNTKSYLFNHHFEFYDKLKGIETSTSFHILVPFFWLREMAKLLKSRGKRVKFKKFRGEVDSVKTKGKTIIIYAHGVPYPKMHCNGESHMNLSEDNLIVAENLRQLMVFLRPDEVIYPHFHEVPNFSMVARIDKSGAPLTKVTKKLNLNGDNLALVDYVPFRDIAIKKIAGSFSIPARVV